MSHAVNHIAISVTDIQRARDWYRDVLGLTVLMDPVEISAADAQTDPHLASLVRTVFGPRLGRFMICHMSTANGVGIELFQFIDPPAERREENFEYWLTGYFHIALTDPNPTALADRVAQTGGRKRTGTLELVPGSGKKICFCEDPFGNVIEIYSHSYEQFWANSRL
jgi:catechol 2,3-dioxygenase-like lactoylglutathione lyase family enzyme